jgi:MFS family permease
MTLSPRDSLRAFDLLNLFLAALLAGFGPRAVLYLADLGWGPADIGLVMAAGAASSALTQTAAGDLIDILGPKRLLMGLAIAAATIALLFFVVRPDFCVALAASVLLGVSARILGMTIRATSMSLVGCSALSVRLGRNERLASIGSLAATGALGGISYLLSARIGFLVAAALCAPTLLALMRLETADIHLWRSCDAVQSDSIRPHRIRRSALLKDRRLLTIGACMFLFQLANASVLPLIAESLSQAETRWSTLVLSVLVMVRQVLVFSLAPPASKMANRWGRRPLLLIGLAAVPIRAIISGVVTDPTLLIFVQLLDGLTAVTLSVVPVVIVADLTDTTGRFNFAQGLVGTMAAFGVALSTSASGLLVQRYGRETGFQMLATAGLIALATFWLFMPETKPQPATD